jgi:hypothetical protein
MKSMMDAGFQLGVGERLLWSGKPRQGLMLRSSDLFAIPFSLLWCAFVIFWQSMVVATQAPVLFQLWGVPFIVIGLYIVVGRFFVDAAGRGRTDYAVTSQRIIIISGLWSRQTASIALSSLSEIALIEGKGNSGTITFGPQNPARRYMPAGWPSVGPLAPVFDSIEGARAVYDLIRRAQQVVR